ncbi:hypothetical protein KAFR_0B05640 [Kazachstania africana CBS 2517]|uniref:Uncharacterized protein n=1 Tax=Kazachstania africana (strain ATCC 22294 / BCRC 22015 / CBS 2517 / CECT 1963 / NBRC 1671 / NRRL Y-8276) TaxID=1071382 RepID=H2AR60_KAZAF|nr:hypothetical protein KAFR_0B05640 [Kazachstania africana CBS 2517]CCF56860.1 hypothetical protein KAFR_0B05640 [Kazachstania africana CBS 2517]
MHNHRIDSFLISENVKLEIVHESNPYFAGEHISMVFRLKHLGLQKEYDILTDKISKIHQKLEEQFENAKQVDQEANDNITASGERWSMKSLFNAFRKDLVDPSEKLKVDEQLANDQEYMSHITKQLQYHKPVNLISGYVQISGTFQYNASIIDDTKFSNDETKIVGVNSSMRTEFTNHAKNKETIAYFQSNFESVTSGLMKKNQIDGNGGLRNNTIAVLDSANFQDSEYKSIPILLIPQSLLFSEITLQPGETKIFHYKSSKLPEDLVPTYRVSDNFSINYNMSFGVSKVISNTIVPSTIGVPIYISPYVTKNGFQYNFQVDKPPVILSSATIKELKKSTGAMKRSVSVSSAITFPRRKSSTTANFQKESTEKIEFLKKNFIKLIESNENEAKDVDELIELQVAEQFPKLDELSDNEYSVSSVNLNKSNRSTRRNVKLLRETVTVSSPEETPGTGTNMASQIANLQKRYIINRNGQFLAKISFSKLFYTTAEDISLVIHLDNDASSQLKVSAINANLESMELINPKAAIDPSEDIVIKPKTHIISEFHVTCFDDSTSIPLKLTTPKSPLNQLPSQFKTNIFQLRWIINLKLILISKTDHTNLFQFYEDQKGTLFHSIENLEGEEFTCRIPVTLLPPTESFGGW